MKTKSVLRLVDSMLAMQKEIEGLRNEIERLQGRVGELERPMETYPVIDEINELDSRIQELEKRPAFQLVPYPAFPQPYTITCGSDSTTDKALKFYYIGLLE
jgi:hypothetical protein